ncbi:MAG: hypothetical protein ACOH1R_10135, partial [Luteimonas sp.]
AGWCAWRDSNPRPMASEAVPQHPRLSISVDVVRSNLVPFSDKSSVTRMNPKSLNTYQSRATPEVSDSVLPQHIDLKVMARIEERLNIEQGQQKMCVTHGQIGWGVFRQG